MGCGTVSVKRGIALFGCAAAVALGSLVTASPAVAKECPFGTQQSRFEGICSPVGGGIPQAPISSAGTGPTINTNNGYPIVNGIPCTPERVGVCYGMIQNG